MVDVASSVTGSGDGIGPRWNSARLSAPRKLSVRTVQAICAVVFGGIAVSFWWYEGVFSNVAFTAAVTATLAGLVAAATRRLLLTTVSIAALVAIVNFVSAAKREVLGMVLHAYDIVFYLGSWSTVSFLWSAAPSHVALFFGGLALTVLLGVFAWRHETPFRRRSPPLALATCCMVIAIIAALAKPERRQTQFYWNALYVSSFYSSWAETVETLWRGQLIEAATSAAGPPFLAAQSCSPAKKPPHIVLIHQESIVQPSLFPKLAYDRSVDPFFQSDDGRIHKMRVETYGGASWLTEFSILTGLSTHSFGGMRPFVQSLLAGKVRDTLPEALARCGYRNVLFYPMLRNFVSNARFYDAIGIREIYDLKSQKAPTSHERDQFYFRNALVEMDRHISTSPKPLFTYIQTMSAHWPYDYAYAPEMTVAGGGPGTDPEMHEYLRRLSIAKLDYDELIAEMKRRFPDEPILVIRYGDHHPMATRSLLGFSEDTQVEEVDSAVEAVGFITYYAVTALNHPAPPLPALETVDVPYLGAILLEQAGLPMSEPYRERMRLMARCDGRYHGCARRGEILGFHRRLLDSALIDGR